MDCLASDTTDFQFQEFLPLEGHKTEKRGGLCQHLLWSLSAGYLSRYTPQQASS